MQSQDRARVVKMIIAYNSAYVQTEALNFTFARQAVIVYFDAES